MQMTTKPTVLIVDDAPDNLMLINMLLQGRCHVLRADGGAQALALAQQAPQPDLILLDVLMPEMDGYDVCKQLKSLPECRDIPVIFLTSRIQAEDQRRGFNVGAVDYITKPINPDVLQARVSTHLQLKNTRAMLLDQGLHLQQLVLDKTEELLLQQYVQRISSAAIAGAPCSAHCQRLQGIVGVLAQQMQSMPAAQFVDSDEIPLLQSAIALTCLPPLPVPQTDLANALDAKAEKILRYAFQMSRAECENFDGSHAAQTLSGNQIPIGSRLLRVAVAYERLTSNGDFKPALTPAQALAVLREHSAQVFDPDVVNAAIAQADQLHAICKRTGDDK